MSGLTAAAESQGAAKARRSTGGFVAVVEELRTKGSLTIKEVANLTGVDDRQAQRWAAGTSEPAGASLHRLLDANFIVRELLEVYEPEGVRIWLHSRNRALADQRPIDVAATGDFEPVLAAVRRLVHGND